MNPRPGLNVAVVMRRVKLDNRWQPYRWELVDVVPHEEAFGTEPRRILADEREERWLHPGLRVELYRDDAEGYYLNATVDTPCWFVLWRMEERPTVAEEPIARPEVVTVSYHDAGRWLDAQENVEQVPAPPEVVAWMREFADAHYVPEPRKRKRPASFQPLQDRFGNPASVTTIKKYGGGEGGGNG